jgi:MoaA/NifB/PqqE/SkfB family radical SAM enzyme
MTWDVPASLATAADLRLDDELWAEPIRDGLVLRSDSLRKVYVEATGHCNVRCAMCQRQVWSADSGHMTAACFDQLLSGLPVAPLDRFTLAFGGFGEPTIHPQFLDMVGRARQAHLRVEIITNGTTITAQFAQDLAALGVAQVTVSVDGGNDEASLLYTHTEHLGGRDKTVRSFDVGHVERTPLREIWRDPPFRALRARLREYDMSPCLACGGCFISETNEGDCFGTPFPACSECLWAQGIVLCP